MTDTPRPPASVLRAQDGGVLASVHAGRVPYRLAWDWQRALVADRQMERTSDMLLLLEHPAVYTRGKRTNPAHIRWDASTRSAHGVDLIDVDRGGDVTYHGPGQLVGYPIIKLASIRSVVDYVRALEAALIDALATFGVSATRVDGYTGVWVGDEKIAAIGVRVASGGITSHGFALNVAPDLAHFAGIVPCGISDRGVCSLASLGIDVPMHDVATTVEQMFATRFNARLERQSRADHERRYPQVFAELPDTSAVPA